MLGRREREDQRSFLRGLFVLPREHKQTVCAPREHKQKKLARQNGWARERKRAPRATKAIPSLSDVSPSGLPLLSACYWSMIGYPCPILCMWAMDDEMGMVARKPKLCSVPQIGGWSHRGRFRYFSLTLHPNRTRSGVSTW